MIETNRVKRLVHLLVLIGIVVSGGLGQSAWGDGKVFPPAAFERAETPSQRALLHWKEGIETLVVETTVRSTATNLTWIIPLPSSPLLVRAVDPGLFPTLQTIFQPRVLTGARWTWIWGILLWALVLVVRWSHQRKVSVRLFHVIVVLGVMLILTSMLLPSLGVAKGGGAGGTMGRDPEVTVLSEQRAGVFDVVTLTATKADHLTNWLEVRGFQVPSGITPVVQDYLGRGWVFVAARVRNPTPGVLAQLHPLLFRFASDRAVYPMRLTGVGAESLDCDLYVFGQFKAEADGWQVRYCGVPDFSPRSWPALSPFPLRVRNPELTSIVAESEAATKLSARLDARGMSEDVVLRWRPVRSKGQTLHSWEYAASEALFYPTMVLGVAGLLGAMVHLGRLGPIPWFSWPDRWGAIVAGVVYLVAVLSMSTVRPSGIVTIPRRATVEMRESIVALALKAAENSAVQASLEVSEAGARSNALSLVRRVVADLVRDDREAPAGAARVSGVINRFTGRPVRLEASPGNLDLEFGDQGLDLVWYDFDGAVGSRFEIPRLHPAAQAR